MYKTFKRLMAITASLAVFCIVMASCSREKAIESISTTVNLNVEDISQENIMNIIRELVSEKYKGRLAGSQENLEVAQYITDYFKEIGLENPKGLDNYMYEYFQPIVELKDKPVMQILDQRGRVTADFDYPENFVLRRLSSETNMIDINGPLCLIDDINMLYKDKDKLKGKILLIPWKYYSLLGSQNTPDDYAKVTEALCVISEFNLDKNDLGYRNLKVRPLGRSWKENDTYKPFAYVDSDTFSKLAEAEKAGSILHFACTSELDNFRAAPNCIGLIPGSDPELKDEFIIIGAHFDHVGDNMDGTWNPGALDNASGVAAMMEIARVIKENKIPVRKSMLFMAFNGEESGISGSWSYCQGPVYPLNRAVMISLDMIGSTEKIPLAIGVASDKSDTSLSDAFDAYAEELSIEYETIIENGSDHTSFDYHGVPSICLANLDLSHGYHSPFDTIETINGDRLEEVVKLVLYYIEKNAY